MIREIARYDFSRYEQVNAWPLAEALLAYEALVIERAIRDHRHNVLSWQIGGSGDPPRPPAVLGEE
jgi:hypothetical protein